MISVWRRKGNSLTWAFKGSRATPGGRAGPPLLSKSCQDPTHPMCERLPG